MQDIRTAILCRELRAYAEQKRAEQIILSLLYVTEIRDTESGKTQPRNKDGTYRVMHITHIENEPFIFEDRKITEFLLKPGAKHYKEFADVGYSEKDPQRLYDDIVAQFDFENIQEKGINAGGNQSFEATVSLGVTSKKTFVIGLEKRPDMDKLRLVTVHRIQKEK